MIAERDPPPRMEFYHPPIREIKLRLNSRTLIGDLYRLQLAFNKFKRSIIKIIPNYFK